MQLEYLYMNISMMWFQGVTLWSVDSYLSEWFVSPFVSHCTDRYWSHVMDMLYQRFQWKLSCYTTTNKCESRRLSVSFSHKNPLYCFAWGNKTRFPTQHQMIIWVQPKVIIGIENLWNLLPGMLLTKASRKQLMEQFSDWKGFAFCYQIVIIEPCTKTGGGVKGIWCRL